MADELQDSTPSQTDDLTEFAHSFTVDEPETNPVEPEKPTETPPVEPEKPTETPEKPAEEEENPFKTEEKAEKPAVEEEIPEKPGSKASWDILRASRDRHKAEAEEKAALLQERETEFAELKAKAARAAELEDKLKAFDEQEKELALARVESTLEYKNTIEAPLKAIGEQVEILTTSNEGDVGAVRRMLVEADPAKQRALLKEITSGWDEIDRIDLKKMAEDARVILDKQDAMRANSHAAAKEQKEIAAQREAEQKETVRKEYAKATSEAVKSVREKVPFTPLVEGETEDDRYSVLSQKVAQVDFDAQTPRAKALAVASTFALPQAIRTIEARDAEITSLKEALTKATKDKPSVSPKADTPADEGEKDFFEEFGIKDRSNMFGAM
jgi:hypothetical protein